MSQPPNDDDGPWWKIFMCAAPRKPPRLDHNRMSHIPATPPHAPIGSVDMLLAMQRHAAAVDDEIASLRRSLGNSTRQVVAAQPVMPDSQPQLSERASVVVEELSRAVRRAVARAQSPRQYGSIGADSSFGGGVLSPPASEQAALQREREARRQRQQEHQQPRTPPRHQTAAGPSTASVRSPPPVPSPAASASSPLRRSASASTSPFGTVPPSPDTPQRMLFTHNAAASSSAQHAQARQQQLPRRRGAQQHPIRALSAPASPHHLLFHQQQSAAMAGSTLLPPPRAQYSNLATSGGLGGVGAVPPAGPLASPSGCSEADYPMWLQEAQAQVRSAQKRAKELAEAGGGGLDGHGGGVVDVSEIASAIAVEQATAEWQVQQLLSASSGPSTPLVAARTQHAANTATNAAASAAARGESPTADGNVEMGPPPTCSVTSATAATSSPTTNPPPPPTPPAVHTATSSNASNSLNNGGMYSNPVSPSSVYPSPFHQPSHRWGAPLVSPATSSSNQGGSSNRSSLQPSPNLNTRSRGSRGTSRQASQQPSPIAETTAEVGAAAEDEEGDESVKQRNIRWLPQEEERPMEDADDDEARVEGGPAPAPAAIAAPAPTPLQAPPPVRVRDEDDGGSSAAGTSRERSHEPTPLKPLPSDAWEPTRVGEWLASIGLGIHAQRFIEEQIDGASLRMLSRDDLTDIGVHTVGHRLKILRGVADLGAEEAPQQLQQQQQAAAAVEGATTAVRELRFDG